MLTSSLALFSYQLTRHYLLDQRESTARRQAFQNARSLREALPRAEAPADALTALQTSSSGGAVARIDGEWFGTTVGIGQRAVPDAVLALVDAGDVGHQRRVASGVPYLVVGVPIPATETAYFEFVPMTELRNTLDALLQALVLGAGVATIGAALLGSRLSRRVLRPVQDMARSAGHISEGSLERLEVDSDPDLEPLVASFNEMVAALQSRIERERRFASDVSHELRTPLAAMAASVNVARRQASNEAARTAVAELQGHVDSFTRLVLDLLEISKAEAGVTVLQLEDSDLEKLARAVLTATERGDIPVTTTGTVTARVDRRRLGQVLTNLLDNADNYGGGAVAVAVESADDVVRIAVDDAGPGVPEHERAYVFERFARGDAGTAIPGTGLGLALVAEHVRLHGGRAWVETSPVGGARFVIELPRAAP